MAETTVVLQPQYDGANIATWIGFRELMRLAEEAVLQHFRGRGFGPGALYRDYGVRFCLVDSSVLISGAVDVDDAVVAEVEQVGGRYVNVRLSGQRDGTRSVVLRGRATQVLVRERPGPDLPDDLAALVVDEISGLGTAVGSHDPQHEEKTLAESAAGNGSDGFRRSWRVPYSLCHYSDRMQYAGYVQALDGLIDEFLIDRGLPVGRLLAERGWMPAVTRARIRLLADARLDETLHAVYSVNQVVRSTVIDGRLDWHVRRGETFVPTATGIVQHGYALAGGPEAGRLVALDPAMVAAVTGHGGG